jgi:hypothetical protein
VAILSLCDKIAVLVPAGRLSACLLLKKVSPHSECLSPLHECHTLALNRNSTLLPYPALMAGAAGAHFPIGYTAADAAGTVSTPSTFRVQGLMYNHSFYLHNFPLQRTKSEGSQSRGRTILWDTTTITSKMKVATSLISQI